MKKFFFMAATAALALSSCSSDELVQTPEVNAQEGAVAFSVYTGRQTRSTDEINDTKKLGKKGFGVFAYEQSTTPLNSFLSNTVVPNFFYNQKVLGYREAECTNVVNGTDEEVKGWGYSPVKYFSNNPGALHSFFAYAPYTETLSPTTGNPRLLTNSIYGGPALEYTVDLTGVANQVDILTAPATLNMTKPSIDAVIPFHFKHALASLKFNVQAWVDKMTDKDACDDDGTAGDNIAIKDAVLGGDKTTITIKSLKLIGNFAKKGVLRLVDGKWDTSTTASETIELLASDFNFDESSAEEQKLLGGNAIYFIPQDGDEVFKIQITYEVTTTDEDDSRNSSTITNTIISEEAFPLAQNTAYEYHLNLGMTTVKFTADVVDWVNADEKEVDLPCNYEYTLCALNTTWDQQATAPASPALNDVYYDTANNKVMKCTSATDPVTWAVDTSANGYAKVSDKYYKVTAGEGEELTVGTKSTTDDLVGTAAGYYTVGAVLYEVK